MIDLSSDAGLGSCRVLFANDDWRLAADGLEHRDTGYFIAREALCARRGDGLWAWPLHLSEKSWCTPRLFREAFLEALERFGIARDPDLARSFAVGFGLRSGSGHRDGFVSLGDLVRPKSIARKRPLPAEGKRAARSRPDLARPIPAGASA